MTRLTLLATPALLALLAGCAATGTADGPETAGHTLCRNDDLAQFTGQKADAAIGAAILKASHARVLRWGPPRTGMTMDMRPDRVTVTYDDAMIITGASCG